MASGEKSTLTNGFDDWALRNGYFKDAFSGEVQIPTIAPASLLDLTVPAGQTWYRRHMWYTNSGGRVARFKIHRRFPAGAHEYFNRTVLQPNLTEEIETFGKYPAGSRIWITIEPERAAGVSDTVTARLLYIALPWEE